MKTAWFLGHRIREAMNEGPGLFYSPLGGQGQTVEADETYVGGKAENRAYRVPRPKQAVMALVERGGAVRSFHVPNVTHKTLRPIIGKHIDRASKLMSDEAYVYTGIGWQFGSHRTVAHAAKEYVRQEAKSLVHTNTVEGYFSILKRGIIGVYHHVSEAHLQRYLHEFDFRYTNREKVGINDVARTAIAVAGARGKRLTYETTRSGRAA